MAENQALAPLSHVALMDSDDPVASTTGESSLRSDISGPAKAAIIVRFLLNEGADVALESLPDALQGRLADQMARMGLVTRETLAAVIREFAEALDGVGLTFPNDLSGALTALDGKISTQTANRLRKEAGVRLYSDPWQRLREMPVEDLVPVMEAESTEVAAVLLSKLEVGRAAELLNALPGPLARRVTFAVSKTAAISPDAVDRIGLALVTQLDLKPATAFGQSPEERLGEILNQSAQQTRDEVLTSLDENDAPFATAVRNRIFTFADIPARVEPRDVPKIVKEVDPATLVTALCTAKAAGLDEASEHVLANLSNRMADNLREEMSEMGDIRPSDGEAAMTVVTAAIRRLEVAGELTLIRQNEDT